MKKVYCKDCEHQGLDDTGFDNRKFCNIKKMYIAISGEYRLHNCKEYKRKK